MDSNTYSISEDEIKFEVERLRKEELEQKVKEETIHILYKEKELQDNKEKFLRNFFDNDGLFYYKENKGLNTESYDTIFYKFKDFLDLKDFEFSFWEKVTSYNGFSKCPTCKKQPEILKDHICIQYGIGLLTFFTEFLYDKSRRIGKIHTSGRIRSIQCCEHLFDFQEKKRYIKLSSTPFKNNPLIETVKYINIKNINGRKVYSYQIPECWEEYIPYMETFKTQETSSEEKIAKELSISKQKKEIQILESLLSEAREKLKALEVV
jgi:hypothetical protein